MSCSRAMHSVGACNDSTMFWSLLFECTVILCFFFFLCVFVIVVRHGTNCRWVSKEGARTSASLAATPFCRASCGVCHWQQPDDGQNFLSRVRVVKSHGPVILLPVYAMLPVARVPQASNSAELLHHFSSRIRLLNANPRRAFCGCTAAA
jgi:hypothetical protein